MMADEHKSRLGRGLAALIGDVGDEAQVLERQRNQRRVPIEIVKPNPRNPRRVFADAELDELAASVRERGIIQPILLRTVRGAMDQYVIVERGLNVRQVEEMARRDGKAQARYVRKTGLMGPDPDTVALEKRLTDALGLTVRIMHRADGKVCSRSVTAMSSSSMTWRGGWR